MLLSSDKRFATTLPAVPPENDHGEFPLELTVWNEQRASDDDVIVGICWELRDMVVDRSGDSRDDDREKQQTRRAQLHGDGIQHGPSSILCLRGR